MRKMKNQGKTANLQLNAKARGTKTQQFTTEARRPESFRISKNRKEACTWIVHVSFSAGKFIAL
jgi:ribosomal protein S12